MNIKLFLILIDLC